MIFLVHGVTRDTGLEYRQANVRKVWVESVRGVLLFQPAKAEVTAWYRVIPENSTIPHVVKKFLLSWNPKVHTTPTPNPILRQLNHSHVDTL
jgi:hypothetical protein